jgi:hypothetical protein
MRTALLAASLLAVIGTAAPVVAQQSQQAALRGARAYAPHERFHPVVPYRGVECSDPGAHLGCPAAPVHDNTPPPS